MTSPLSSTVLPSCTRPPSNDSYSSATRPVRRRQLCPSPRAQLLAQLLPVVGQDSFDKWMATMTEHKPFPEHKYAMPDAPHTHSWTWQPYLEVTYAFD
mmetsp:Transcript_34386/g.99030  ORF Transcript_34386/g.99030 Transcript_34386/m.99030 type:complete len:98 (-) Transcript_34386:1113-1406(-)